MKRPTLDLKGCCLDCGVWAAFMRGLYCLGCAEHREDGHAPVWTGSGWCHVNPGMKGRHALMYQRVRYSVRMSRSLRKE